MAIELITARTRSLREGNVFIPLCQSVHGGGGRAPPPPLPPWMGHPLSNRNDIAGLRFQGPKENGAGPSINGTNTDDPFGDDAADDAKMRALAQSLEAKYVSTDVKIGKVPCRLR